jgi:hypothetical protein
MSYETLPSFDGPAGIARRSGVDGTFNTSEYEPDAVLKIVGSGSPKFRLT